MAQVTAQQGRLLVSAAGLGVVAALLGALLLWLLEVLQRSMFVDLPEALGLGAAPWWWAIGLLAIGATLVVLLQRAPATTGKSALTGFHFDTPPATAAVALAAAVASLGFGFVLGPEAALILLGTTCGALLARALGRGDDPQAVRAFMLLGGTAAIGAVFGNPFVTMFMVLEIAAFGAIPSAMLLPALVALASGYLVQIGVWAIPGIGTHGLSVPGLPTYSTVGVLDLVAAVGVAIVAGAVALATLVVGRRIEALWTRHRTATTYAAFALTAAAVAVAAALRIGPELILFSGNGAMPALIAETSLVAVAAIVLLKAVAYSAALGGGLRGGPVFPATFLGVGVGVAAALLIPGISVSAAAAAGIAAACAAVIRLPATSALLAFLLVGTAGVAVTPMAIIGAVVGVAMRVAVDRTPAEPA